MKPELTYDRREIGEHVTHHEQLTVIPNWFIQLKNETGKNVKRGPAEWLE